MREPEPINQKSSSHSLGYHHVSEGDFQDFGTLARTRYQNLQCFNELPKGGHFVPFEQPEAFVEEIRACFAGMRL